jgi:hypothetical protein
VKPVTLPPGRAGDDARPDRIDRLCEHDRHSAVRPLHRGYDWAASGQHHVRRKRCQLRRVAACEVGIATAPPQIDAEIAPEAPAELLHALLKCRHIALRFRLFGRGVHQHTDTPHAILRLRSGRAGNERRHRAAEQGH